MNAGVFVYFIERERDSIPSVYHYTMIHHSQLLSSALFLPLRFVLLM